MNDECKCSDLLKDSVRYESLGYRERERDEDPRHTQCLDNFVDLL